MNKKIFSKFLGKIFIWQKIKERTLDFFKIFTQCRSLDILSFPLPKKLGHLIVDIFLSTHCLSTHKNRFSSHEDVHKKKESADLRYWTLSRPDMALSLISFFLYIFLSDSHKFSTRLVWNWFFSPLQSSASFSTFTLFFFFTMWIHSRVGNKFVPWSYRVIKLYLKFLCYWNKKS